MKKPWYYRMLLSYLPVFFFITSFLFFLFFQEINSQSKKDAVKANEILIQSAINKVENEMESLDYDLAHFSIYNQVLYQFFQSEGIADVTLNTKMLKEIAEFKRQHAIVDSIYLVRPSDQIVFSEKYIFELQQFPDNNYIEYLKQGQKSLQWSSPRDYIDFNKTRKVITLAKYVYLSEGDPCIVVANVSTETIRSLTEQIYKSGSSFISVKNAAGEPIFRDSVAGEHQTVLSEVQSSYLGWTFRSGVVNGEWISIFSTLSSLWMILGFATVILGTLSIFYITKKNYAPLETVVSNLLALTPDKKDMNLKGKVYEFAVIETAIANIKKQNMQLQKQKVDSAIRKRQFLHEILLGTHHLSPEEWSREMERYQLPTDLQELCVLLIEIDGYTEFARRYSRNDQLLFKYALYNVSDETFRKYRLSCYVDWFSDKHLGCLLVSERSLQDRKEDVLQAAGEIVEWVKEHLPYSATIGIGSSVKHYNDIPESNKDAQSALKQKIIQGTGAVITHGNMATKRRTELFGRLQTIHALVNLYRIGDKEWPSKLYCLFDEIRSSELASEDIISLLNYLVFQLDRSIGELGSEFSEPWQEKGLQELTEIVEREETLTAIKNGFYSTLTAIRSEIDQAKETKGHHEILRSVREYIEHHYNDPDLSLDMLSDAFHLNPKYLSQLFKEHFGERFMEFLTQLRIEQAKLLLTQTKDPIQEIAGKVGYANSVSFMRSFKKVAGQSPGDYRRNFKAM
jgi:two-component system, response regulator YesN